MAGRPPRVRKHEELIQYLEENGWGISADFNSLPRWLGDVFQGACGQMPGNTRLSPAKLWRFFLDTPTVDVVTVLSSLNQKRAALGQPPVQRRYAEYYTAALFCAGDAITYHKQTGKPDYEGIPVMAPLPAAQRVLAAKATIKSAYKLTDDGEVVLRRNAAPVPLNAPVTIHGRRYSIDFVISVLLEA